LDFFAMARSLFLFGAAAWTDHGRTGTGNPALNGTLGHRKVFSESLAWSRDLAWD
jgi:hypothetical protein